MTSIGIRSNMVVMNNNDKLQLMNDAVERITQMIQDRLDVNESELTNGYDSPMDNVPDEVKVIREQEAMKMRAVKKEQKEILQIIQLMFPKNVGKAKKSTR